MSVPEAGDASVQETCDKKDMQCFLGTVNYYRRFNPQHSQHSTNLTATTRKTAPDKIDWTDDCMCGFKYLILNICMSLLSKPMPQGSVLEVY